MKKDIDLERVFDEYAEGGASPSARVTEAAKNSIKSKKTALPLYQRALIAIAGVLSAGGAAFGLYSAPAIIGGLIDAGSGDGETQIVYYSPSDLSQSTFDVYAQSAPQGLDFMKNLYLAENCSVISADAYSDGENLAYVRTEITASVNACRHEAVIYAEYAEENSACELFSEYYGGAQSYYGGYTYLYLNDEDNGEYVKKIVIRRGGVNYYLCVTSSDEYAYRMWLDLLIK
ncbi:MAG: hypothetical protein NC033_03300 [Clostridiales bacterium]|nr:hypothetical protein [Clostridiales bacterium]